MTGGAFGSIVAQAFHMTAAERKALLVVGRRWHGRHIRHTRRRRSAGCRVAALRVEAAEPGPRGGGQCRRRAGRSFSGHYLGLVSARSLFAMTPLHGAGGRDHAGGVHSGACWPGLCLCLTGAFMPPRTFHRLPIHWMWWPAIGGLAIGIGGHLSARARGWLRQHRRPAAGDFAPVVPRRGAGQVPIWAIRPGLGNVRRRAGAVTHHGRGAGRTRT